MTSVSKHVNGAKQNYSYGALRGSNRRGILTDNYHNIK